MTVYLSDTFTDSNGTALTTHTPDVGTGWVNENQADGVIEADSVTNPTFANGWDLAIDAPVSADYQVTATLICNGGVTNEAYLVVRNSGSDTDGYKAGWDGGSGQWEIWRVAGGADVLLGGSATNPVTDPSSHVLVFSASGSTLALAVDGATLVTETDATTSSIGQAGMRLGGVFSGWLSFDDYELADIGGGGGGGVHSGLSGQGFISTGSMVGVEVDLSGIDSSAGAGSGYPTPRYHVGSISFSVDGAHYSRLAFLSQPAEVFATPFPSVTSVAYSFAPGITATITEIAAW